MKKDEKQQYKPESNCENECENDFCDLDSHKICDNCGQCLDYIQTNDGFAKIKIDRIEISEEVSLEQLYKMYGLDDDE